MITLTQFLSLRSGDLVVWREKYLRTVVKGPADERGQPKRDGSGRVVSGCVCVEFAIRRRSWRGRPNTIYNFNDVRKWLRFTGKRGDGLMLESEWLTLQSSGFGLEDIRAELREEEGRHARMSRLRRIGIPTPDLCRAYPRLKRLIEGA